MTRTNEPASAPTPANPVARAPIFQAGNTGQLPVPWPIGCLMVGAFGLPAIMLVATTWREVPRSPWLLGVYLASLFPFAVLFAIKRLMTRYALRVFDDGVVEVIFPFKTVRIEKGDLAAVALSHVYVHALKANRTWVVLAGHDGRSLATFSPSAFRADALGGFFDAIRTTNPDVKPPELP